jgi:hypothetical protein
MDEAEVVVTGEAVDVSRRASSSDGCCRSAIKLRIAPGSAESQPREGLRVCEGFAYTRGAAVRRDAVTMR